MRRERLSNLKILLICLCFAQPVIAKDDIQLTANNFNKPKANLSPDKNKKNSADDFLMNAMGLLGVNYKFGGNTPEGGLDCSGFIQYVFKNSNNTDVPRTSKMMSQQGTAVARADLKPGDLIFFSTGRGRAVTHVGVYLGNDRFMHAPRTGKTVEIAKLTNSYWNKAYLWARRIKSNSTSAL